MNRRTLILRLAVPLFGLILLSAAGCKNGDDAATNTKDSQYMGGGNTAADQIGEQRRKARLPRAGQP